MKILAFGEGKTEEIVLKKIEKIADCSISNQNPQQDEQGGGDKKKRGGSASGKHSLNKRFANSIVTFLQERTPVRCLVLRDLDSHDGETFERIKQSVVDALRRALVERDIDESLIELREHPVHDNVFTLALSEPDFRFALHVAGCRWMNAWSARLLRKSLICCVQMVFHWWRQRITCGCTRR